jgi:hypothetical protein
MLRHEIRDRCRACIDADLFGHVQGKEIARFQKAIQGFGMNVVGIDKIRPVPTAGPHGLIGLLADIGGAAADDRVFAVRFVPNRGDGYPLALGFEQRAQLCGSLMGETVAKAHRIFWQMHDVSRFDRLEMRRLADFMPPTN